MEDPRIKPARLNISELEKSVRMYFTKGLAPPLRELIRDVQDWYLKFCTKSATAPLPINESQLCSYVSFVANEGLKHRLIKSYQSAICRLQPGPLFLFEDGRFLTSGRFVDAVRTALSSARVDQQKKLLSQFLYWCGCDSCS